MDYDSFPPRQRVAILIVVCFSGIMSPLSSLMYTPALPAIANALHVSISDVNLTVTTYLIFQGITPSIWGSISDVYGRRPVYLVTLFITVGASIGLCLTESFTVVLILRALHATGCSSTRALGAGVIRDIVPPSIRGGYMGLYGAGVGVGTAFGPFLGGLLAQYTSWHGIFYFILALSIASFLCVYLLLPETLHFVLLSHQMSPSKSQRYLQPPIPWIRHLALPDDASAPRSTKPPVRPRLDFLGPLRIIQYPDVLSSLLFTGIAYTVWQDSMVATSTIYTFYYDLTEAQVGLTYIANGVGSLLGDVIIGRILNYDYQRQLRLEHLKKNNGDGRGEEEALSIEKARMRSLWYHVPLFTACMLGFGWIVQERTHIAASIIVAFFIGWMDSSILSTYSTLIVDLFENAASSSSASINLVRCLLGAVGSSTIQLMINAMDVGWTFTTLSGILALSFPLILYQYYYGHRDRIRRLVRERVQEMEKLRVTVHEEAISPAVVQGSSPVYGPFPIDYDSSNTEVKKYAYIDADVCNGASLQRISRAYIAPSLFTLQQVLTSAFCATIFRITCEECCAFALSLEPKVASTFLKFTVDPMHNPCEIIFSLRSSLSKPSLAVPPSAASNSRSTLLSFRPHTDSLSCAPNSVPICEWQLSLERQATRARIHFDTGVYSPRSIEMFADVFRNVLDAFGRYPSLPLATLPLEVQVSPPHKSRMSGRTNTTMTKPFVSLVERIRSWGARTPNRIALDDNEPGPALTYAELDQKSSALAAWLRSEMKDRADQDEVVIGAHYLEGRIERWFIISCLACWKAGYAYMPISSAASAANVLVSLNLCGASLVLGHSGIPESHLRKLVGAKTVRYVDLAQPEVRETLFTYESDATELSCVLATSLALVDIEFAQPCGGSGSKLNRVSHGLLCAVMSDGQDKDAPILLGEESQVAFHAEGGTAVREELWSVLARGATLVVPPLHSTVSLYPSFVAEKHITAIIAPYNSLLTQFDNTSPLPPNLKSIIIVAQDAPVPASFIHSIQTMHPDVSTSILYRPGGGTPVNAFQYDHIPAQCKSDIVTLGHLRGDGTLEAFVVDSNLRPVLPGVCGELLLAAGSGEVFLESTQITAGREEDDFEKDRESIQVVSNNGSERVFGMVRLGEEHVLGSRRVYRTGDLVRQRAEGAFDLVKRTSLQARVADLEEV